MAVNVEYSTLGLAILVALVVRFTSVFEADGERA
jgi:hypothetical protein